MTKKKPSKKTIPFQQKPVDLNTDISSDVRWKWFIAFAAVVSFGLSVFNDYALDDFIVIVKNNFTQKGFSGIWSILSKDTFAGMTESDIMVLSGGRYRPLSLVTFAIENQLWGNQSLISHLINVLIYVFIGILLFYFLKNILAFPINSDKKLIQTKAALITLLFITLPAHSEPVVNIKGRDDLMCLMFFLVASIQLFKYIQYKVNKHLLYSSIFFFLSLMSKETALTFVLIFPLMLYFFTNATTSKKIKTTSIYTTIAILFIFFRYLATKDNHGIASIDVLNNPFINATPEQKFATIFLSLFYYLRLMLFPIHLSYDYNYNQIPLTNFTDWRVLLSIIIHLGFIVIAISLYKKKSIYSFAILFYFITFSILSNFFFNIGTIFADRFIFIPSIGFCIALVFVCFGISEKFKLNEKKKFIISPSFFIFLIIISLFSIRNIARCNDWKNNNTLFIADTKNAPNSAKIQLNAGIACIYLSDKKVTIEQDILLNKALHHLQKGINIHPGFTDGYMNVGVAYSRLRDLKNAEVWWNKARKINPKHEKFPEYDRIICNSYIAAGLKNASVGNIKESIINFKNALNYDSLNIDVLYNLGGAYFTIQKNDSAKYFFQKVLQKNPSHQNALDGLNAVEKLQGK